MKYKRTIQSQLENYINNKEAIVLTGARQVGKTTLARMIFNTLPEGQKVWFDFESPLDRKLFEDIDYDDTYQRILNLGVSKSKRIFVFIDEIQYYPKITSIIKYLIDHYNIKFFVTGSSSYYMKNLFPESLSGRKFVFHLTPLTFQEFLDFKNVDCKKYYLTDDSPKDLYGFESLDQYYEEYLNYGGFPKVVLTENPEEKDMVLKNIFTSYFEKDVVNFGDFKNVAEIRDLILLLIQRTGQKLDITKLSSILGINRSKIYDYLYFLESTFFISLVGPYSKSVDRRLAGGKKLYFIDTGLINKIATISQGSLFENAVHNQLKKYEENHSVSPIMYYQNRSGSEIDFILNNNQAFEVKLNGTLQDERRLIKLSKKLDIGEYRVISKNFVENLDSVLYPQFI